MKPVSTFNEKLFASIILVTRNRPEQLKACLDGIYHCDAPFLFEIVVVVNGDCSVTERFLEELPEREKRISILKCESTTPAQARNFAIKSSSPSEFLCFLDDDVVLPREYFQTFWRIFQKYPSLDVLGGPDRTFIGAGIRERSIGLTLLSPLATARTRYRHGGGNKLLDSASDESKLILCNLWFRRSIFVKEGMRFDERFFRNEENVLLYQLQGKQLLFSPEMYLFHHRKKKLKSFIIAVSRSGYYRAMSGYFYPGSAGLEYYVPSLFLCYVISLPFCSSLNPLIFLPVFLYLALNFFWAIFLAVGRGRNDWMAIGFISVYQFLINISYGAGFLFGLTRFYFAMPEKELKSIS